MNNNVLENYTPLCQKQEQVYTESYCEENVYKLCEFVKRNYKNQENIQSKFYAVFITNQLRQAYIRQQAKGDRNQNHLCVWDYHVIFIHKLTDTKNTSKQVSYVYDFDSKMSFPCQFDQYFENALNFQKPIECYYRIIESDLFLENFASDRSHMIKRIIKGMIIYDAKAPDYEPIFNSKGCFNNLFEKYVDLQNKEKEFGIVVNQDLFKNIFKQK